MTKEQLAEREFSANPLDVAKSSQDRFRVDCAYKQRAAFIKGLELAEEFALWIDNKSPALQVAWAATFKLFLTEKYGNEQQ